MKQRTIKGIRSDLNLSQEELAKELDISLTSMQKYERYESRIPATFLIDLASKAGLDPREIKIRR